MSVLSVHLNPIHGFSKLPQTSITLLKGLGVKGDCHLGKTTQHLWRMKKHAAEPNLRQVHLIQSELFDEPDFHGEDGVRILPGQMGENVTTRGIDLLALGKGTRLHFVDEERAENVLDERNPRVRKWDFLLFVMFAAVLLEVVAMAEEDDFSWTRIAIAPIMSLSASLSLYCASLWPDMTCFALLVLLNVSSNFHIGIKACFSLVLVGYVWYDKRDSSGEHAVITVTGVRHPCKKVEQFRAGLQEKCVVRGGEKNGIIKRKAGIMAVVTKAGTVKPGMTIIVETASQFEELPVLP